MKIHALQAHPKKDSLNGALYNTALDYFKEQGHEVSTLDIYEALPDLLASAENVLFKGESYAHNWVNRRFERTDFVEEEIARVHAADLVFIQTPIWVYQIPSFLKLYIEQIFVYNKFFRLHRTWRDDFVYKPLIKDKKCLMCITMGGHPKMVEAMVEGDIDNVVMPSRYTIEFSGFEWLDPHLVFRTTAPPDEADDYLGAFRSFLEQNSDI